MSSSGTARSDSIPDFAEYVHTKSKWQRVIIEQARMSVVAACDSNSLQTVHLVGDCLKEIMRPQNSHQVSRFPASPWGHIFPSTSGGTAPTIGSLTAASTLTHQETSVTTYAELLLAAVTRLSEITSSLVFDMPKLNELNAIWDVVNHASALLCRWPLDWPQPFWIGNKPFYAAIHSFTTWLLSLTRDCSQAWSWTQVGHDTASRQLQFRMLDSTATAVSLLHRLHRLPDVEFHTAMACLPQSFISSLSLLTIEQLGPDVRRCAARSRHLPNKVDFFGERYIFLFGGLVSIVSKSLQAGSASSACRDQHCTCARAGGLGTGHVIPTLLEAAKLTLLACNKREQTPSELAHTAAALEVMQHMLSSEYRIGASGPSLRPPLGPQPGLHAPRRVPCPSSATTSTDTSSSTSTTHHLTNTTSNLQVMDALACYARPTLPKPSTTPLVVARMLLQRVAAEGPARKDPHHLPCLLAALLISSHHVKTWVCSHKRVAGIFGVDLGATMPHKGVMSEVRTLVVEILPSLHVHLKAGEERGDVNLDYRVFKQSLHKCLELYDS